MEAKTWKRSFKLGHLYVTFSNCRVKKRQDDRSRVFDENPRIIKEQMHQSQGGRCPICGRAYDYESMQLHHVLPWCRFPELRSHRQNLMLLCTKCHHEIHNDPYKNIRMMREKAAELGINLEELYATSE